MRLIARCDGEAVAHDLTLDEAAELLCLDPAEVAWSVGEFGCCTGLDSGGRELTLYPESGHGAR